MSKRKPEEEAGTSSSKKFRADNDSTGTMELSAFEELPEEMKDQIFQHLSCNDIRNMALVSKSINFFVGTSSMIMSRFKITLDMEKLRLHNKENDRDENQQDEVSVGERNYSNLTIKKVLVSDIPLASALLTKFGLSVKEIDFQVNISMTMLQSFLEICKNVQIIKTNASQMICKKKSDKKILDLQQVSLINSTPKEIEQSRLVVESRLKLDPAPLDLCKLKVFECCFSTPALALFGNCQLKELAFAFKCVKLLKFNGRGANSYDLFEVKKFLEKQNSLELMKFGFGSFKLLFFDDFMGKMSFRLKSLHLEYSTLRKNSKEERNFCAFIKLHEHSLERLQCDNPSTTQYFADFKTLSTLEVTESLMNLDDYSVMPHIKNLSFAYDPRTIDNNSIKFPNLKELKVNFAWFLVINKDIFMSLNVEKLTLNFDFYRKTSTRNFDFQRKTTTTLNMPNLKRLHLIRCPFQVKPFEFDGNQLEELTLESNGSSKPHWLINYLGLDSTNLKLLKITNMDLDTTFQEAIEANRHKIEKVVLIDVEYAELGTSDDD